MATVKYATVGRSWEIHAETFDEGPYGEGLYGEYWVSSTVIGSIVLNKTGRYDAFMASATTPFYSYKTRDGAKAAIVRNYERGIA